MRTDILLTVSVLVVLHVTSADGKNTKPNVLIFIADDLGIGDIGCFGNGTIKTPYLDKMAAEGVKLTQHFAAASFCTPSRAALLTGRYPLRSGMAAHNQGIIRFFPFLAQRGGLPTNETTFGKLAKSVGYRTAFIGKWHLGFHKEKEGDFLHSPLNHGFDYYYGIPWTNVKDFGQEGAELVESGFPLWRQCLITGVLVTVVSAILLVKHGLMNIGQALIICFLVFLPNFLTIMVFGSQTLLNSVMFKNRDVIEQPIVLWNLTRRFVGETDKFLDARQNDQDPFLMVMSWHHVHTHIATNEKFTGKSAHGRYGDGVEEMDWGVGQILASLDRRGMGENTFVYFTSDNGGHLEELGAHGEQDGGWNGVYKGGKTHGAVEGGIRVPTLARWPAQIPGNTVTNEPTIFMDVFPTIAKIIGAKVPTDRTMDGNDLTPLLTGKEKQTAHKFMVHYCGDDIHAARYRPDEGNTVWKLVFKRPDYMEGTQHCLFFCTCYNALPVDPPNLYDINADPSENSPIDYSTNKKLQSIVLHMKREVEKHRAGMDVVESQFSWRNTMWNPVLQPCCGGTFPFCGCQEEES